MPKLPFKDSEYYDQNNDDEGILTPEDMENVVSFVSGETDENPFEKVSSSGAVGGFGGTNSTEKSVRSAVANNNTRYPTGNPVKMTKRQLRNLSVEEAKKLLEVDDLVEPEEDEEDELEEVSTCAGVAGVQAPLGSEIWGGKRPAKLPDGWKEVDSSDVQEPNMKKSFMKSALYKNQKKQKRESKEPLKLTQKQFDKLAEDVFNRLFSKN